MSTDEKQRSQSSKDRQTRPEGGKSARQGGQKTHARPGSPVRSNRPKNSGKVQSSEGRRESSRDRRVATKDDLEWLSNFEGKVLTASHGEIPATQEERAVCALLEDGTFIVDQDDPVHPVVSSVRARLRRRGVHIKREIAVDLSVIRKIYQEDVSRQQGQDAQPEVDVASQRRFLELIDVAARHGASDIHIHVQRYETKVEFRVDNELVKFQTWQSDVSHELLRAIFVFAETSDAQYRLHEPQSARLSRAKVELPGDVQNLRMQFVPSVNNGRKLTIRLQYAQASGDTEDVDTLGYHPRQVELLQEMRQTPNGIVVISGPTGSGKSTTLQRSLVRIYYDEEQKIHIITVEDPPEYIIPGAVQIPITNATTDRDRSAAFTKAISSTLRSDPDVIMIGELRDAASAKLGFEAAMTGHRVYTTLHANDGISILGRLQDMGVEAYKLYDDTLVIGLVGQRLVRHLCPDCALGVEDVRKLGRIGRRMESAIQNLCPDTPQRLRFANPKGCKQCKKKGYIGRTVVAEVIRPDVQFMDIMRDGAKAPARDYWINELEGFTLLEHAAVKVMEGQIDPNEVRLHVGDLSKVDPKRIQWIMEQQ